MELKAAPSFDVVRVEIAWKCFFQVPALIYLHIYLNVFYFCHLHICGFFQQLVVVLFCRSFYCRGHPPLPFISLVLENWENRRTQDYQGYLIGCSVISWLDRDESDALCSYWLDDADYQASKSFCAASCHEWPDVVEQESRWSNVRPFNQRWLFMERIIIVEQRRYWTS